jgi:predicted RecB family nuclease
VSRTGPAEPVLLGGYAAKQCPVRTHNDFTPLVPVPEWVPSAELQALFDAGRQFEAEVFAELVGIHPDTAELIDPDLRKPAAIARTLAAMESGVPLVLGGWLPDDTAGGRKGRPDLLVRVGGGYLPADVKHHKTLGAAKKASKPVSSLARPDIWWELAGCTATSHHYEDGLQLAHYTRMLQACGFHPGPDRLFGAIIGTSTAAVSGRDQEPVFVWHDLSTPTRPTFSRSRGKAMRSVLERYDHEHDFRVKVAATAARITGAADDPEPLVVPIGQKECGLCPYELWCADQMGPEDPSAAITRGRLDTREWQTLRRMGIATTGALADLEPRDPAFFDEYRPEVTQYSRDQALKRLQAAVQQARMIRDGVDFQPIAGPAVEVPSADIEIDFDIEWDTAGRIYQWGLRVRDGQDDATARYQPVVSFEPLDDEGELALAERAAAVIAHLRAEADASGRTVAVYHWAHPEVSMTRKFGCVATALDGLTVDLRTWFTGTFHVRGEASIKAVAQFFGFTWAVDDPGGRLSMAKIDIARGAGAEALGARQWCLDYNESDVAAQAAIRDGVRQMHGHTGGRLPGRTDRGPAAVSGDSG